MVFSSLEINLVFAVNSGPNFFHKSTKGTHESELFVQDNTRLTRLVSLQKNRKNKPEILKYASKTDSHFRSSDKLRGRLGPSAVYFRGNNPRMSIVLLNIPLEKYYRKLFEIFIEIC